MVSSSGVEGLSAKRKVLCQSGIGAETRSILDYRASNGEPPGPVPMKRLVAIL
jgi:hypothetical protein